jgi:heme-degrading monooxygenase HmoA
MGLVGEAELAGESRERSLAVGEALERKTRPLGGSGSPPQIAASVSGAPSTDLQALARADRHRPLHRDRTAVTRMDHARERGRLRGAARARGAPGHRRIEGCRGAYVLRRDLAGDVELVTLTLFDSLEAVRAFAGDDHEAAVVPEQARRLLSRFDERSAHYELVLAPFRTITPSG